MGAMDPWPQMMRAWSYTWAQARASLAARQVRHENNSSISLRVHLHFPQHPGHLQRIRIHPTSSVSHSSRCHSHQHHPTWDEVDSSRMSRHVTPPLSLLPIFLHLLPFNPNISNSYVKTKSEHIMHSCWIFLQFLPIYHPGWMARDVDAMTLGPQKGTRQIIYNLWAYL